MVKFFALRPLCRPRAASDCVLNSKQTPRILMGLLADEVAKKTDKPTAFLDYGPESYNSPYNRRLE